MEKTSKVDLLESVSNISTIPTLPSVIERISTLLKNPQTSAEEIGKAITTDQALASKVLKLVNSAFYGFPGKISTITHAVVILGFSTIKNIVLTASIIDTFKKSGTGLKGFNIEEFWLHSIACGAAAKSLAKHIGVTNNESFFIGGLIHDIGKIILCQYLPDQFNQIINNVEKKNILIFESEKELFATTHQEIGGYLVKTWNLPPNLQQAVYHHHYPVKEHDHYTITAVVHCADILIRALGYGNGGDDRIPCIDNDVWSFMRIDSNSLPAILTGISNEVEKARIFMKI